MVRRNQGHRLYVGTTHMDAQTLVVWNMGAVANSGHPDALDLFQDWPVPPGGTPRRDTCWNSEDSDAFQDALTAGFNIDVQPSAS